MERLSGGPLLLFGVSKGNNYTQSGFFLKFYIQYIH